MKLLNTCLSLLATCVSLQASAVSTVLLYDSPTNPNAVNITNAAPAPYPFFVASFALGFLGNTGGVINFDPLQSITPYPALGTSFIDARYGIGMVNNMNVSFGNPVDMAPSGGFQIPISGVGALHQPIAAPLAFKLTPSNGLPIKRVGFTVIQSQGPQIIKVEFIQAAGPVIVASQAVPMAPIMTQDVFIGRQATVPGGIVAVIISVFSPTGAHMPFVMDDLAFRQ